MDDWQQPVLMEGVKFGFAQISAILDRWRERRRKAKEGLADADGGVLQVPPVAPELLDGSIVGVDLAVPAVADAKQQLNSVYAQLAPYADGREQIDPGDQELEVLVEEARTLLEGLYGQHLTFKGEMGRPSTGTVLSISTTTQIITASGSDSIAIGNAGRDVNITQGGGHDRGDGPR